MITLNRLTEEEIRTHQVLYLATYAPSPEIQAAPALDPVIGIAPYYNYELFKVLQGLGLPTTPCHDLTEFMAIARNYNYVFSIYNRAPFRNSEVFVSSLCEFFKIPYLGAPPNLRALAEDKWLGKIFAQSLGIPTTPSQLFRDLADTVNPPEFAGPYFTKPRFGATSEEISKDSVQFSWPAALSKVIEMLNHGKECLVEQAIIGVDLTVGVLGGNPPIILPVAEDTSLYPYGIITFQQKRRLEQTVQRRFLSLTDPLSQTIRRYVQQLSDQLKTFDYLRVDFRFDPSRQQVYFLEIGFGSHIASYTVFVSGMQQLDPKVSHADIINHIVSHSFRRQQPPLLR